MEAVVWEARIVWAWSLRWALSEVTVVLLAMRVDLNCEWTYFGLEELLFLGRAARPLRLR